jgi:nucleoid-associated protein YgaU
MGLTKATLKNLDTGDQMDVLFNPTQYSIKKDNQWKPKPVVGKNVPKLDFTGGGSRTLTMELFFDVYEQKNADVRDHVNKLWDLTMIDESKKNPKTKRSRHPLCLLQWGPNWTFKAALTSLAVTYTLFREDGTPVRATANVTLQEAEDDTEMKGTNPTSFAELGRKRREVRPHDSLALISYEEYGTPNLWRKIAEDNDLDNPADLQPGQIISVPALD